MPPRSRRRRRSDSINIKIQQQLENIRNRLSNLRSKHDGLFRRKRILEWNVVARGIREEPKKLMWTTFVKAML